MKTFIKLSFIAVFAMMFSVTATAASSGSCQSSAASLSLGTTVKGNLVDEYDPDYGENTGYPVYYFKLKVNKGDSATLVMSGESPYIYDVYEDGIYEGESESSPPMWEDASSPYAAESRFILRAGDWDEDAPKSVTYYVVIDGNSIGDSFSLQTMSGEVEATLPQGIDENTAVSITPKESFASVTKTLTEAHGSGYYFKTQLTAGQKYYFGSYDNTTNVTDIAIYGLDDGSLEPTMTPVTGKIDGTQIADDTHAGYCVIPSKTATYIILVSNKSTNKDPSVTLYHKVIAARLPKDHPLAATLGAIGSSGASAPISPAYRNNPTSGFFDAVIDDALVSVTLEKGKKYLFVVDSLNSDPGNLIMELCDSKGNVLVASKVGLLGEDVVGPMFVYEAAVAGVHYVGVCQNTADSRGDESPVPGVTGRLSVSVVTEDVFLDEYDLTADDPNAEITPVTPAIGEYGEPPEAYDVSGQAHNFGLTDWKDTVSLPVRKGITYSFSVTPGTNTFEYGGRTVKVSGEGFAYAGVVYTLSGTTKTVVKQVSDLSAEPLSIQAGANATYYLEITKDGQGVPAVYSLHSMASAPNGLGYLTVNIHGPAAEDGARWYLKGDSASLNNASGTTILLPAGPVSVKFTAVKGFSTAVDMAGTVKKDETTTFDAYYNDTADPLDDWPNAKEKHPTLNKAWAPTKLAPTAAKPLEFSRSLWVADSNDWYVVTASKEGVFYKFAFVTKSEGGDAQISVFGPNSWTEECSYVLATNKAEAVQICATKGTYYICVSHADPAAPKDTSYTLRASMAEPGQIKLAKGAISVKEDAAYVDVGVSRTGKDGKVCVKYRTESVTARPGEDYYSQSGVLTWENGDNKAKTVRVKLIPDLVPTCEGLNKTFNVAFETFSEGDPEHPFAPDEYIPSFTVDSKTKNPVDRTVVTLTEVSKADNGTVQVKCANPKKPEFTVKGGEPLTFVLERTGYTTTNATVEVTVDWSALGSSNVCCGMIPPPSSTNVVWNAGDVSDKTVSIVVPPAADMKASKKGAIKLSVPKSSKEKVKFAAASISVVVENEKFAMTVADWAKALSKNGGMAVKEKKAGTWFVMDDGSLKNLSGDEATITFTVTGPCTFKYAIDGVDQPEVKVPATAKKAEAVEIKAGAGAVVTYEYVYNDGKYELLAQATQYGYAEPVCDDATAKLKVAVGKLPDGIKLEQDRATKKWYVRGVPTKDGCYYAEIAKTVGRDTEPVTNFAFKVIALRSAIGTFNGLAMTTNTMEGVQTLAQVQLTVPATGKLAAKVAIGGKSYQFKCDTGFAAAEGVNETNGVVTLTAELPLVQTVTIGGRKYAYTNVLSCTVQDFAENDPVGWRASVPCELRFAYLPAAVKGDDDTYDAWYDGRLCRDNTKVADWVAEAMKFKGYYTVALVPTEADDCEISALGNGYLTLTFDDKGKVKVTGALADGTAYSASSVPGCLGGLDATESVRIPLYACKGKNVFGGWLTLRATGDDRLAVAVFDGSDETKLSWNNDDPAATYDGFLGYRRGLGAVGGWYDTVFNLQRYYLDRDFSVDFPATDELDLLTALLPEGFELVAEANPNGQAVDVAGNNVTVEKQALVKTLDEKGKKTTFNDWTNSVNAANVKLTFKRATGILTGTCDLWYEGKDSKGKFTQKAYTGCKHAGVLLWNRDDDTLLADDIWTAGAVVIPQTINYVDAKNAKKSRKWNASFRFNVRATADPGKLPGGAAWQE